MATKVIMPQLGESVVEGTVTRWLKAEGDPIEEFEPIVEVNTDKVDTEIPSPAAGVLLKILVAEDATVKAGTVLAWLGEPGEVVPEVDGGQEAEEPPITQPAAPSAVAQRLAPAQPAAPVPPAGRAPDLGFISPVVARIASQHNLDLSRVTGTGRGGRITKKDVLAFLEARPAEAEAGQAMAWETPVEGDLFKPTELLFGRPGEEGPATVPSVTPGEIVRHTPVRRAIAEHMLRSVHTSPHVTTVMEADLSRVVAHRAAHKEPYAREGVKLTFTPYFVVASVLALKGYPLVNSSWSDEGVVVHQAVSVGMATSLGEEGLIVPVIKNADTRSLLGIAQAVNDLSERARTKKLDPREVQGGTFTITNHGTSGSLFATPIINQPQCAILGVGVIQKRPVVIQDAIAIRPMVYLSLTFDHRILDGASGDQFLSKIVETLEAWPE